MLCITLSKKMYVCILGLLHLQIKNTDGSTEGHIWILLIYVSGSTVSTINQNLSTAYILCIKHKQIKYKYNCFLYSVFSLNKCFVCFLNDAVYRALFFHFQYLTWKESNLISRPKEHITSKNKHMHDSYFCYHYSIATDGCEKKLWAFRKKLKVWSLTTIKSEINN